MFNFFSKETVWSKVFGKAEAEAIPDKTLARASAEGRTLCVAHVGSAFYILDDRCPHNGFSLSKGWCSVDMAVVCPLHRYRFDLKNGRAKSGIADYVRTYRAEMREDGLYVGIENTRLKLL